MPKKCSVFGCTTNRHFYEPGLHFFRIPQENVDLQARWLQLIGRDPDWKIPNVPTVCQKHFTAKQVLLGRNLDPDVVPSLNLPDQQEDNPQPNDNPPRKVPMKRAPVQTKPQTRKRRRVRKPELVLVEPQDFLITDACCRMCSLELKVSEGLEMTDAWSAELVSEPIWNVCFLQSDFTIEGKICSDCWCKMQEFSNFVQTCHEQQKLRQVPKLIRMSPDDSTDPKIKDEEQVSEEIDENEFDEQNSDLPPLEGLSIDEMLETLDKIVVKAPRRNNTASRDDECLDCGEMFPNRSQTKVHRKTCSAVGTAESLRNKTYTCEICSKPFNSRVGYRGHLQRMHRNDTTLENTSEELRRLQSKKRLQCPLCPDRFQQLHQLKYHLKTHKVKSLSTTKPIKVFRKPGEINDDNADNSFYCELCDKTIQNRSYRSLHMKFHKRERDFPCDQCDKKFFARTDLKNHIQTIHQAHSFLCGICGKTYGARRAFNRHMMTHSADQKPYKCTYCPNSFYTPSDLKYHVTRHTGEKSHECEICGQAFRLRHMLTHHKKKKHGLQVDAMLLAKMDDFGEGFEEVLEEQLLDEDGAQSSEDMLISVEMT